MKLRNVIVGTALVGAALKVGRWSSTEEGRGVDAELFGELNRGHGPEADRFFTGVTELGSIWAAGAAAGILALTGRRRAAANAFAAAGVAWLAGQGLKKVAHRPRPYDADADGTRLLVGPAERHVVAEQPPRRPHGVHARGGARPGARPHLPDGTHRAWTSPSPHRVSTWACTTRPTWSAGS